MSRVARSTSLRLRLTAIIFLPLLSLAVLAGLWQIGTARQTAQEVFDRALLSAALAVANDIAFSQGDALSPRTARLLAGTSGGPVFYHMYAPDGVIVAGYATPPVGIPRNTAEPSQATYFDATYRGRSVRGVRIQNRTEIGGFAGIFTTTVWQDSAVQSAFVRDLVLRALVTIAGLIAALAVIVWFGVRIGLRPLTDLEEAIEARSSSDLSPIRRAVPREVDGIVGRLNTLFGQVTDTMAAQSQFIGNAAHQLRNPIAGVLSLAESVVSAPTPDRAAERAQDLLDAARSTADLGHKLLMLERAEALTPEAQFAKVDLSTALPQWLAGAVPEGITLNAHDIAPDLTLQGDATMLREAIANLIDNALRHGGPDLSQITLRAARRGTDLCVTVEDNGRGIEPADIPRALERFAQISDTSSSGLGLSLALAVARGHGGTLRLEDAQPGLRASLVLPV